MRPFCDDSLKGLIQLAGDIVADAAVCYKDALIGIRRLEARRESGYYDDEVEYMRKRKAAEDEYWKAIFAYEETIEQWKAAKEIMRLEMVEKGYSQETAGKAAYKKYPKPKKPAIKAIPKPRFSHPSYYDELSKYEKVRDRERAFFLSSTYSKICGYDGRDAMHDIERIVARMKFAKGKGR